MLPRNERTGGVGSGHEKPGPEEGEVVERAAAEVVDVLGHSFALALSIPGQQQQQLASSFLRFLLLQKGEEEGGNGSLSLPLSQLCTTFLLLLLHGGGGNHCSSIPPPPPPLEQQGTITTTAKHTGIVPFGRRPEAGLFSSFPSTSIFFSSRPLSPGD